jgi:hypothetical protein
LENISILYIGLGPKIQIFVEAGPARLPLIRFPAAQLEAQRARPVGGLRPHDAEVETEPSASPADKNTCGIRLCILHELLGGKSLYKEAAWPDFGPKLSRCLCPSCPPSPL